MKKMKKKNIVIKIGGSLLFKDNNSIDSEKIIEFCDLFKNENIFDKIVIVCGGGIVAREYINAVRRFGGNESLCDLFGIEISRINSKLIISYLGDLSFPRVPTSIEALSKALLFKKIIIMGGLQPGQSTTSVAIEVAEFINANEIIILSDVDGIYDKDPNKFKDAKLLEQLNYSQLEEIILKTSGNDQAAAGEYRIFDTVSLQLLKRSNIPLYLMNGRDLNQFKNLLSNQKPTKGTRISN